MCYNLKGSIFVHNYIYTAVYVFTQTKANKIITFTNDKRIEKMYKGSRRINFLLLDK